jgi:hypothetical protein
LFVFVFRERGYQVFLGNTENTLGNRVLGRSISNEIIQISTETLLIRKIEHIVDISLTQR